MSIVSLKSLLSAGLGPTQPVADEEHLTVLQNWLPTPNGLVPLRGTRRPEGNGLGANAHVMNVDGDYIVVWVPAVLAYIVGKFNSTADLSAHVVSTPTQYPSIAQTHGGGDYVSTYSDSGVDYAYMDGFVDTIPFRHLTSFRNRVIYGTFLASAATDWDTAMDFLYGSNPLAGLGDTSIFWASPEDNYMSHFRTLTTLINSGYVTKVRDTAASTEVFYPIGQYFCHTAGTLAAAIVNPAATYSVSRTAGIYTLYDVTTEGYIATTGRVYRIHRLPLDIGYHNLSSAPTMLSSSQDAVFVHNAYGVYHMVPAGDFPTFSIRQISSVPSATVVSKCSQDTHMFVDTSNQVHAVDCNGVVQKLDYSWLLDQHGLVDDWTVYYSDIDNAFIITDTSLSGLGQATLMITASGAATTDVPIIGCTNSTYYCDAFGSGVVQTSPLTFGTHETKMLKTVRVESDAAITVTVKCKESESSAFRTLAYRVSPDVSGVVAIDKTGFAFTVEVRGASTTKIADIKLNVETGVKMSYSSNRKGIS